MSKTPEEMAEEYCENHDECEFARDAFLAGYQAANKLYAAKLKEANDTIDGMVDECEGLKTIIYDNEQTNLPTPAKWISVKERLPEEGQRVLLYNSLEYVSIVMAHWYSSSQRPFFDHVTIDDIHLTFALEDNKHLYWMPLPAPPKEEG